jgi:hypothetical protein
MNLNLPGIFSLFASHSNIYDSPSIKDTSEKNINIFSMHSSKQSITSKLSIRSELA